MQMKKLQYYALMSINVHTINRELKSMSSFFHVKLNPQSTNELFFSICCFNKQTEKIPTKTNVFSKTTSTRKNCPEKQENSQFCEICVHICKTHLNDSLPRT